MAIRVWNALSNGHGGLDWAGLDVLAATLGIRDIESLINRLITIKLHKPKE
jgi:hypothetical protein